MQFTLKTDGDYPKAGIELIEVRKSDGKLDLAGLKELKVGRRRSSTVHRLTGCISDRGEWQTREFPASHSCWSDWVVDGLLAVKASTFSWISIYLVYVVLR